MKTRPLRILVAGWLAWLAMSALTAQAAVAPEPFFRHPDYAGLRLSPSGNFVAALVPVRGRLNLAVIDLEAGSSRVVAAVDGRDIRDVRWVSDRRLVFTVWDLQAGLGEQRGEGLFAIERDGSQFRELAPTIAKQINSGNVVYRYTRLMSTLRDGSDDVMVLSNDKDARHPEVYRLDTHTGRREWKTDGKPGDVEHWVVDRDGDVRAAVTVERGTTTHVYFRPTAAAPWIELASFGMRGERFVPVSFDGDGTLVVASDVGRGTAGLFRYDAAKRTLGELMLGHPHADLGNATPIYDRAKRRIVGFTYEAERPGAAWFDEDYARLQKSVDAALPQRMNVVDKAGKRALVASYSDRQPVEWYLLDLEKSRMELLASSRKAIREPSMPARQPVRYKARDGLEIPAYVTLPPDGTKEKLPLVLLVHGGPWVRGGHWAWNPEAAYLASLGYAVLEPDFRGSLGWGRKLHESGWKQWGLAMQDDLDDGVDWLAGQGTIDPKRVCIMGASYGGYAVMMGLARNPERYRCGVNYVGVTDIDLMFSVTWSDFTNSDFIKYSAREMIGDPDRDAAQLRAASPLANAGRIKAPVLMAYGGKDYRVPLIHGERMRNALADRKVPVEWVVYNEEGHGFLREDNRIDFYTRVAKFLEANLR